MSGNDMTNVDPGVVTPAAVDLTALTDILKRAWEAHRTAIEEIHAAKPWRHDEVGKAFERAYLDAQGGGDSARDTLERASARLADLREKAAAVGISSMATQAEDEDAAEGLRG
jgi:hypothetical protein